MFKILFREYNVIKKHGRPSDLHTAVVYPSTYVAAISSLATHILYFMLNRMDSVIAERIFLKYPMGSGLESYRSIEFRRKMKDFNILFFSVHYELDYVNIVDMLVNSKIPLYAKDRRKEHPIIIIGGPTVTANPEPLAEIADVLVIGEVENILSKLVDIYFSSRNKSEFLDAVASVRGIYVPFHGKYRVFKNYVENLNEAFYPIAQIQAENIEPAYGRGVIVETTRGCKWYCQFCMEGFISKPKRDRSFMKIKKIIEKGLEVNNVNKVIFYALSFFDHNEADRILEFIVNDLGINASIPSLRPSLLNDYRLELMVKVGQKTLTIAPETLCWNIGAAIKKFIVEHKLIELISKAVKVGFKNIKLYFIIGFPNIGFEEVHRIVEFTRKIFKKIKLLKPSQVKFSLNPLIPKPQTPLQWLPLESLETLHKKMNYLTEELRKTPVTIDFYEPKWAQVQATIALGSRDLSKVLELWYFYGKTVSGWYKALRHSNVNVKYIEEGRSLNEELPWSHINLGISLDYLKRGYMFFNRLMGKRK